MVKDEECETRFVFKCKPIADMPQSASKENILTKQDGNIVLEALFIEGGNHLASYSPYHCSEAAVGYDPQYAYRDQRLAGTFQKYIETRHQEGWDCKYVTRGWFTKLPDLRFCEVGTTNLSKCGT